MKRHRLTVFDIYFLLLFLMVTLGVVTYIDIINIIYFIVVLCSLLKFNIIVNEHKK